VISLLARLPLVVLTINWLTRALGAGVESGGGVECTVRMAFATNCGLGVAAPAGPATVRTSV
jgi:hypothetical protein